MGVLFRGIVLPNVGVGEETSTSERVTSVVGGGGIVEMNHYGEGGSQVMVGYSCIGSKRREMRWLASVSAPVHLAGRPGLGWELPPRQAEFPASPAPVCTMYTCLHIPGFRIPMGATSPTDKSLPSFPSELLGPALGLCVREGKTRFLEL